MKKYDLIAIGTGSAMNIVETQLQMEPDLKIAVIDKDEPGGICLTRGCIPTKMLIYPADLVRAIEDAGQLGIEVKIRKVDFKRIMERMRSSVGGDVEGIREALSSSKNIDYYPARAEFTGNYQLKVQGETITSKMIFLCLGSRPAIPPVEGVDESGYQTSDTILNLQSLPSSMTIVGGGYIAAEFGHFFSSMGSKVTVVGRNAQFLPQEEPEVSALAQKEMSRHMRIITNHEVFKIEGTKSGQKRVLARNRETGKEEQLTSEELLVAAGRAPNTDILCPEKSGINVDEKGWVKVNEYLETSKPNIWAFGDANGKHLFKHVANYESKIVFYNAVLGEKVKVDYHAVPHAVFSHPEIAAVGLREEEAVEVYGEDGVLIGFHRYQDTARGEAMGVREYFVKIIVADETKKILGAHIIGPHASVLIQEIINLMYTGDQNLGPITSGMHIHPALTEVVERAAGSLLPCEQYQHMLREGLL